MTDDLDDILTVPDTLDDMRRRHRLLFPDATQNPHLSILPMFWIKGDGQGGVAASWPEPGPWTVLWGADRG